ncbi:isocitrate lyase/phosphoenolpyruvate mutase family protein [Bradyrhizobium sp. Pa8]|uniref:isocitrate lyase/phosphoenolpyruvate mutase family protein n=1 Tax=Bradyrhizobium sp. Pa8 TaxID=3386552 RepID=UPI00403F2121
MQDRSVRGTGRDRLASSPPAEMLRAQVCSNDDLSFLMEAHDGLSEAIAERAGFKGLWASSLSIASALVYRDANEASCTQLVDVVERTVDSSKLPRACLRASSVSVELLAWCCKTVVFRR